MLASFPYRNFSCSQKLPWNSFDDINFSMGNAHNLKLFSGRIIDFLFAEDQTYTALSIKHSVDTALFWNSDTLYVGNAFKRSLLLYPFLHIPKFYYLFNPIHALKLSVMYVFGNILGTNDEVKLSTFAQSSNLYKTKGFQVLLHISEQLWKYGALYSIPKILSESFVQDILLSYLAYTLLKDQTNIALPVPILPALELSEPTRHLVVKNATIRNREIVSDLFPRSLICVVCTMSCTDKSSYEKHSIECLKQYYTFAEESISCLRCDITVMNMSDLMEHIFTVCPMNFRAECMYCLRATPRCDCKGRFTLLGVCKKLLSNDTEPSMTSILHPANLGFLITYLEFKRYEELLTLNNDLGDKWDERLNLVALPAPMNGDRGVEDIRISEHAENGLIFHTKDRQIAIRGHFRNMLQFLGVNDATYITTVFMDTWQDKVCNTFDKGLCVDGLSKPDFCFFCLADDTTLLHRQQNHPVCFCGDGPFKSIPLLVDHYRNHNVESSCVIGSCQLNFDDLGSFVRHLIEHHKDKPITQKLRCDKELEVAGCEGGPCPVSIQIIHNIVYHATNREEVLVYLRGSKFLMMPYDPIFEVVKDLMGVASDKPKEAKMFLGDGPVSGEPQDSDTEGKENKESKPTDSRHDDSNSVGGFTNNADNSEGSEKEKDSDGDENKDSRGSQSPSGGGAPSFPCDNQRCKLANISFPSADELETHIQIFHKCLFDGCTYTNTDDDALAVHIQNHNEKKPKAGISCKICGILCQDAVALDNHTRSLHVNCCFICKADNFMSKQALEEHMDQCTSAPFDSTPDYNESDSSPLEMLIDLIGSTSLEVDTKSLQTIKSASIKHNRLLRNPELHSKQPQILFDIPNFADIAGTSVAIPAGRLKSLPRFQPRENDCMRNYMSMNFLLEEICVLSSEFKCDERTFCSLLLQQIAPEAKLQMKSMLERSQTLNSIKLEQLLDIASSLYFQIDLRAVFCQANNLPRAQGEGLTDFFSRLTQITRLASFYLEAPKRQDWAEANIRNQFMRNVGPQFRKTVENREVTNGVKYGPSELLKTFLAYKKEYVMSDEKISRLFRVGATDSPRHSSRQGTGPKRVLGYRRERVRSINEQNDEVEARPCQRNGPRDRLKQRPISARTIELFRKLGRRPAYNQYFCLRCGSSRHTFFRCDRYRYRFDDSVICRKCNLYHTPCG